MFVAAWLFIAVGLCLAILGVRGLWRMRRSTRGTYLPAGTPLRVRVDTQAPHEAILWRWAVVWLEPIAFLVFGLGTLALGAAAALKWVAR